MFTLFLHIILTKKNNIYLLLTKKNLNKEKQYIPYTLKNKVHDLMICKNKVYMSWIQIMFTLFYHIIFSLVDSDFGNNLQDELAHHELAYQMRDELAAKAKKDMLDLEQVMCQ